jgi:hypothetical protein
MMRRLGRGLLYAVPGYIVGAFGGGWLVSVVSSNPHDRSVEAAMTGAFVLGPLAAIIAFVVGLSRGPTGAAAAKNDGR